VGIENARGGHEDEHGELAPALPGGARRSSYMCECTMTHMETAPLPSRDEAIVSGRRNRALLVVVLSERPRAASETLAAASDAEVARRAASRGLGPRGCEA
jgi:hypothetical protein